MAQDKHQEPTPVIRPCHGTPPPLPSSSSSRRGWIPEPLLGPGQEGGDEAGRARSARKTSSLMYCEVPFKDSLCPTGPLAFPSVPVLHTKEPGRETAGSWPCFLATCKFCSLPKKIREPGWTEEAVSCCGRKSLWGTRDTPCHCLPCP